MKKFIAFIFVSSLLTFVAVTLARSSRSPRPDTPPQKQKILRQEALPPAIV